MKRFMFCLIFCHSTIVISGGVQQGQNFAANVLNQTTLDSGITYGKNNLGKVTNTAKNKNQQYVPQQGDTSGLQQYYSQQNPSVLKQNAYFNAQQPDTAGNYAYQQSLKPKAQFNANSPLIQTAKTVTDNVAKNQPVTIQSSTCTNQTKTLGSPYIQKTCRAYLKPEKQTCKKALQIKVDSVLSCTPGEKLIQEQHVKEDVKAGRASVTIEIWLNAYCLNISSIKTTTKRRIARVFEETATEILKLKGINNNSYVNLICNNNQCNIGITANIFPDKTSLTTFKRPIYKKQIVSEIWKDEGGCGTLEARAQP